MNEMITRELTKAWRLTTAPLRTMPSFLIPGAPKSGTSSLYDALILHPQVRRGRRKEPTSLIHYPTSELRMRMNYPFVFEKYFGRGFQCGDASVEYWFHPDAPKAAAAMLPNARIIFVLREPISRAWSEYRMMRKDGSEQLDFATVVCNAVRWLKDEDSAPLCRVANKQSFNPIRYVQCGMYANLLRDWLKCFPREQTLVLFSEELFSHPQEQLGKVWRHLDLKPFTISDMPHARDGGGGETMPDEARQVLKEFYFPLNQELEQLLGRTLPWS